MSALAAVLTAAVPSLVSSPALAEKPPAKSPEGATAEAPAKSADPAKPEARRAKKAHAAKKARPKQETAKQDAPSKPEEAKAKQETKPAATAATTKGKKTKKTASRAAAKGKKTAKKADSEAPPRRCLGAPVALDRGGLEGQSLTLVDCHDRPLDGAQAALSVLARPWGAQKPDHFAPLHGAKSGGARGHTPPAGEVAPGVRLLDRGLLARVDAIAHRFPGRPISLVSGYRPQSRGSLHQSARALDLRVAGVTNEELVAFCKTLPDTGCGYYPNSSFVHFDVRNPGTGGVSWIDASGPGETPHYVHQWPPPPEEADKAVLPPDTEPHDGSNDPWATDAADEHAPSPEPATLPAQR